MRARTLVLIAAAVPISACDMSLTGTHPAPTRPPGCQDTRIDWYIGEPLPDSILVICHPLPKPK